MNKYLYISLTFLNLSIFAFNGYTLLHKPAIVPAATNYQLHSPYEITLECQRLFVASLGRVTVDGNTKTEFTYKACLDELTKANRLFTSIKTL